MIGTPGVVRLRPGRPRLVHPVGRFRPVRMRDRLRLAGGAQDLPTPPKRLAEWTTDDPGKVAGPVLSENTCKARRIVDSGLKEFVCFKAMRSGKAYSSGNWVSAPRVGSHSSEGSWDESLLAEYQVACCLTGRQACIDHIAPGAARFGLPAQEALLIPCWPPQPGVGCWLPPQGCVVAAGQQTP